MVAISSFLKLRQNRRNFTDAEFDKIPFAANRFYISLFVNEIIKFNQNSRWLPGGHSFFQSLWI